MGPTSKSMRPLTCRSRLPSMRAAKRRMAAPCRTRASAAGSRRRHASWTWRRGPTRRGSSTRSFSGSTASSPRRWCARRDFPATEPRSPRALGPHSGIRRGGRPSRHSHSWRVHAVDPPRQTTDNGQSERMRFNHTRVFRNRDGTLDLVGRHYSISKDVHSGVGPAGTGPNLRICRDKSQIRRPSGLPSPGRPPAQIGLRSDLEVARAEVATKSFRRNVSALRNKISHQVDADGEHHGSGWKVDGGQLFPGRNDGAALACARTTPGTLVSSFEPPSYLPLLITITCARRGACSSCSAASSVARVPQDCC